MLNRFAITAPITKIDDETRTIEGVATAEVLDAQGEIVDYETAKTVIAGTWPGNLREMHKAEAVGTGVVVECDDAKKEIRIRGTISKGAPNTWEKVKDGTLKAFSIGGKPQARIAEKMADGAAAVRLFLKSVHEISLVDAGACPTAGFSIVKVVGGVAAAVAEDTAIAKAGTMPEPWDVERAAALFASVNCLLANEAWEAGSEGASPAAAAQVEMLKSACGLLLQFLSSEFAEQFAAAADAGTIDGPVVIEVDTDDVAMARLGGIAKAALVLIGERVAKAGARHSAKDQKMVQDVHDTSKALGADCASDDAAKILTGLVAKAVSTAEYDSLSATGFTHLQVLDRDGKPIGQKIAIAAEKAAKPADAKSAAAADDEEDDGKGGKKKKTPAPASDDKTPAEKAAVVCKTCKGSGTIRDGHVACPDCDSAKVRGATPTTPPAPAGTTVETPAPLPGDATTAKVATAELSEVQKLIGELQADRETSKATVTAQAATIADLTKRLAVIEQQPAPGGPVVRAVEKTIGTETSGAGVSTATLTPIVLEAVIKAMPDGQEKDVLLRELIKMNAANGVGVTRLEQRIGG